MDKERVKARRLPGAHAAGGGAGEEQNGTEQSHMHFKESTGYGVKNRW